MATKSLELMLQDALANVDWPYAAPVALEDGWLADGGSTWLTEAGKKIPLQFRTNTRWQSGATAWGMAWAKYKYLRSNQPAYLLHNTDPGGSAPTNETLTLTDQGTNYLIRNGYFEFTVSKATYRGPENVRVDVTGSGNYSVNKPPSQTLGPFYEDEKGMVFNPASTSLTILEQGPVAIVLEHAGWLKGTGTATIDGGKDVEPWVHFATYMTVFASHPIVPFQHRLIFTDDARAHKYAEMGFRLSHQPGMNWFLRYENEIDPHQFVYHLTNIAMLEQWRREGYDESIIDETNLHTYPWLRGGKYLYLHPSQKAIDVAYYAAEEGPHKSQWNGGNGTESKPVYFETSNMQGTMLRNEFAMMAVPKASEDRYRQLMQQKPPVKCTGTQFANSLVQGPIAARVSGEYAPLEEWCDQVWIGFFDPKVSHDYGWAARGQGHEFVDNGVVTDPRTGKQVLGTHFPRAHRQPYISHYMIFPAWIHYMRGGPQALLDVLRPATEHTLAMGICNWAYLRADGGPFIRQHNYLGSYHGKNFFPWGSSDWGMLFAGADVENDRVGHWPDPSAQMFKWLIDCDWIARDFYEKYLTNINWGVTPWNREGATTLAHNLNAWRYAGIAGPRTTYHKDWFITTATAQLTKTLQAMVEEGKINPLNNPNWISEVDEYAGLAGSNQYVLDSAAYASGVKIGDVTTASLIAKAVSKGQSATLLDRFTNIFHPAPLNKRIGPGPLGPPDGSGPTEQMLTWAWPRVAKVMGF
jgi:hypothetical protein